MTPAPVHMGGERLMLDPEGALFWPARRWLVVADLHLEKGSAAATRGALLPPWDTRATLDRLAALLRRWQPVARVVAVGDSFHDNGGALRMQRDDHARLAHMTASVPFLWLLGNHDPAPPDGVGGEHAGELTEGRLVFRHEARQAEPKPGEAEISGHFHPKAQVPVRGTLITRACFAGDGRRLILPAIGAYTGGLDVRDPAIARLFPRGGRAFLLGRERLYSFPLTPFRRTTVSLAHP
jgi:uncharacterized protein